MTPLKPCGIRPTRGNACVSEKYNAENTAAEVQLWARVNDGGSEYGT